MSLPDRCRPGADRAHGFAPRGVVYGDVACKCGCGRKFRRVRGENDKQEFAIQECRVAAQNERTRLRKAKQRAKAKEGK